MKAAPPTFIVHFLGSIIFLPELLFPCFPGKFPIFEKLGYWFADLGFVVAGDDSFHVAHAAVAQLKAVPVKYLMQWV